MSCIIKFSSPLWGLTNGVAESEISASSPVDIITGLKEKFPELATRIIKEDGAINGSVKIYLNDTQLKSFNQPETKIAEDDIIHVIPAVAGG